MENYPLDKWPFNNCEKAGLGSASYTQQVVNKSSFVFSCSQKFLDSRT